MSFSNIKNSSNTININAQYISESASLKTENESLKEQLLQNFLTYIRTLIVNYTTNIKETQRAMSVICGAKNKYNQLYGTNYSLEDLEREIGEALIRVNRKHKKDNKTITEVCNYLFSSIKDVFTQSHEEDYNKGVITKSPKIALFGDLPNIITTSSQLMNSNIRKQITSNKLHVANQYATAKKMPF
ncbi:hypothetical protein WL483_12185 [Staphylococcus warneri]|uniref:hypothetical protein n=1 Tax=Staphylococcus warneri TaxID=1292 RepID=UPI0030C0434C